MDKNEHSEVKNLSFEDNLNSLKENSEITNKKDNLSKNSNYHNKSNLNKFLYDNDHDVIEMLDN